jgi:2-polyprenyl-6-hydroxyphenyl methylase/3-demethylubiquinone-9 3-methyltransferase
MDAVALGFADHVFDVVACLQNGISAFKVDQRDLIREAVRVTRPGGVALFSSYAERFWDHRLAWFKLQADEGLLGEIDWDQTGDGVIVCKDGFRATTVSPEEFRELAASLDLPCSVREVDESSVFCTLTAR